jgi:hypothetical protein
MQVQALAELRAYIANWLLQMSKLINVIKCYREWIKVSDTIVPTNAWELGLRIS